MAFSYSQHTGDGTTRAFTFSFVGQDEGYIRDDDIVAFVDDVERVITLTSSNTLEFAEAPAEGSEVLIRRVMPKETPYSDFRRGNNFGQENINNSFLQLLYAVHEILDGYFPEGYTIQEAVDFLGDMEIGGDLEVSGDLLANGIRANGSVRNVYPDLTDSSTAMSLSASDKRYVNIGGDTMEGTLDTRGQRVLVDDAALSNHPASKRQLDSNVTNINSQISSIQGQLTEDGGVLLASAFSVISWHDQEVTNSTSIPANKNAWSFGPLVTVEAGVTVTVGSNSFWTVANGQGETTNFSYDGGSL